MKIKTVRKVDDTFKPIKLELTIESKDELDVLTSRSKALSGKTIHTKADEVIQEFWNILQEVLVKHQKHT